MEVAAWVNGVAVCTIGTTVVENYFTARAIGAFANAGQVIVNPGRDAP